MSPRLSIIPAGAVTDRSLEPRDLQVLCLLGRHLDKQGWCVRSQVRMASELDCGRSSVQRSLERLVDAGWVEKKSRTAIEGAEPTRESASYAYRVRLDRDDYAIDSVTQDEPERHAENASPEDACPPVGSPEETPSEPENHPQGAQPDGHPGAQPYVGTRAQRYVGTKNDPLERPHLEREREAHARAAKGLVNFEARWPTAAADDRQRTAYAWEELTKAEQDAAIAGIAPFLNNLKRLHRKNVPAGWRYLEEKRWTLLEQKDSKPAAMAIAYAPTSQEGRAILALAKIARCSLFQLTDGRIVFRGGITPRLLAMATAMSDVPSPWQTYQIGSEHFGAWREFIGKTFAGRNLPALTELEAPWPYPPSKEGKIYTSSTGPPKESLMTQEDEDHLERTGTL